jgi:hypothetical protein
MKININDGKSLVLKKTLESANYLYFEDIEEEDGHNEADGTCK